jgi:hypothetical protein
MSFRPEGYPENWLDGWTLCYIKDNAVVKMIVVNPADGLEEQFSDGADSWIYASDAWAAGATTPPSIGYTYDGSDFIAPITE